MVQHDKGDEDVASGQLHSTTRYRGGGTDRPMQSLNKHFYEFGSFRIDTAERQLLREDRPVPLTPKVFDLLLFLVENRGHTLGKDELMEHVWEGTFVEVNNLSRNISMLRKVLCDDYHDSRFIKTIPKRGYRFESDVRELLEEEEALVVEKRTRYSLALSENSSLLQSILTRRILAASVVMLIAAAAFALIAGRMQRNEARPAWSLAGAQNVESFELYNRGRELWRNRSAAGLHEATMLLERSVERDPNFALAHAALADAYAFDTGNWKKTEQTANRAIELDPKLGEPYASLGFVKLFWEWKPAEAERYFRKSIELSPDYATAHQWYAVLMASDGQFNGALSEINRALEIEPQSLAAGADRCQILYFLQRYDDAETQCKKVLDANPQFFAAHLYLYDIYTAKGMYDEAIDEFFKSEQLAVNHSTMPEHPKQLQLAYDTGGIRAFWRARIKTIDNPPDYGGFLVGKYYARLGENDKALQALRLAYEKHDFDFLFFHAEPVFRNCCRNDLRFRELRALWAGSTTRP